MASRQRALHLCVFLAAFFVAWSLRATVFYSLDEQIASQFWRTAYSNLLKFVLWVLPAAAFVYWLRAASPARYLGVSVMPAARAWLRLLLVIIGFLVAVALLETTFGHKSLFAARLLSIPLGVLVLQFVMTPLLEEVLFRGLVMKELLDLLPAYLAGVLTSLLFVGAHLPYWLSHGGLTPATMANCAGVFVFSLVACWLYAKSSSIWPAVVAHTGNNLLAFILVATRPT
jgi:membrane protease YdiL (CAAX protease family)